MHNIHTNNNYNSIDGTKLLMAFLVVGIHVGAIYCAEYPEFVNISLEIAVPFFFVCSGFFLQNKVYKSSDELQVYKTNFIRFTRLYVLWHLIYLPLNIWYFTHNNHELADNIGYALHMFIWVGEILFAWPLWYLHALFVAIAIIWIFRKYKTTMWLIWIISILFMLLGYFINYEALNGEILPLKELCQHYIDFFQTADRNGISRGLALVVTGMMIRKHIDKINHKVIWGIICLMGALFLYYYTLPFPLLFAGTGSFLIAISVPLPDRHVYYRIRIHSTLIYYIHMYFVMVVHLVLKSYVNNVERTYYAWMLTFFISWIAAGIIDYMRKYYHFRWINHFIS